MMRRSTLHAAVIALALAASSSQAAWHVDSGQSSFSFTTAKAGMPGTSAVEEVQTFRQIGGSLADDGKLVFDVELASIETNIGLRNDRLKELLFKVADNPKAVFTGSVDPRRLNALGVGASLDMDVSGQLALGGQSKPLTASVRVVKLASDALLVGTRVPIVVNLKDYGLQDGVEALRAVMNLNVLASSAPVSFSVMMKPGR
ncbi:YceI-like domain protein [Caballeronia arationis]|jgi:polyisoprenoid-binding protein YceI|uniref:Polyisoprenoid-binding protein YceI n=1 Tax=Caballeronia arationis TaxID=1777142 RepID=A0A7Z7IEK8_9BURK|nr:YceI family protein [Caballeronia arationis]SAK86341.1 YceI-like domain protein [Caballeronia arationis]SOE89486.1 Polyisoprenoid-binding protein YceI [Caballeronia arationis]